MPTAPILVFDLRCLQDENYRDRGIGRHAAGLLRHARACSAFAATHTVAGLVDPGLPDVDPGIRALVDEIRRDGYFPGADGCRFVTPSPMTHTPLPFARLVTRPGTLSAAALHDFIPLDEPGRYLPSAAARLDYGARLLSLSWFGLLLPNSGATAARLAELMPVPAGRVHVTGVGLADAFDDVPPAGPGDAAHVLAIGGLDPRKNIELAVRGHAMGAGAAPLVVTGAYRTGDIEALTRLHREAGGRPGGLRFAGHVDDAALVDLYRRALCVVTPSRNEGFSLPVVEAMAAHVPALVSDIPPHRELVADPALRFAPDDADGLAALLGRTVDEAWRRRAVAAGDAVWPAFRARAVAARFWAALDAQARPLAPPTLEAPPVARKRRPRVAFVTPLPPDRSGVADYSAATAAELGRLVDLTLFTPAEAPAPVPGASPAPPATVLPATVLPASALPALLPGFDRVVNVMGNSHFHQAIFHAQLRHGGACICHDNRLLHFYRALLGPRRTLDAAAAELHRPVEPPEVDGWERDESTLPATFLGELAASARPLFLHSRAAAGLVEERFGVRPVALPFSLLRTWTEAELSDASRRQARRRLGVPDGDVLIVSFGYVLDNKAPQECIWAADMLRWWGFPVRLAFVGADGDGSGRLPGLRDELGLTDRVTILGAFATEAVWRDYVLAADLAVQLRSYAGGLSGALMDAVSAGLPTLATADMADATDAPSYVRRTPDRISAVLVAEALADMIEAGLHRTRHPAERLAYAAEHSQATYSRRLCEGLGL